MSDISSSSDLSLSGTYWLSFQAQAYDASLEILQSFVQSHSYDYRLVEEELENIVGAIERAYISERWAEVVDLAYWIRDTLDQRGYGVDGLRWMEMGSEAARQTGNIQAELAFLIIQGAIKLTEGKWEEALRFYELAVERGEGKDTATVEYVSALWQVATVYLERGDLQEARKLFEQSLEVWEMHGDARVGHVYNKLAKIASFQEDYSAAQEYYFKALRMWDAKELQRLSHTTYHGLGRLEIMRGNYPRAREYLNRSLSEKLSLGASPSVAHTLYELGRCAKQESNADEARQHFEESLRIAREFQDTRYIAYNDMQLGEISLSSGSIQSAYTFLKQAWEYATKLKIKEVPMIAQLLQVVYEQRFQNAKIGGKPFHVSSGGVIFHSQDTDMQFVLLHRVLEDTWHLPKGTLTAGEEIQDAALREIREETGIVGQITASLGDIYSEFDRNGTVIPKQTIYFLIHAQGKNLQCDQEHDEALWVSYDQAVNFLANGTEFEYEVPILEKAYTYRFVTGVP